MAKFQVSSLPRTIANTFVRENLPITIIPRSGRSGVSGGPSISDAPGMSGNPGSAGAVGTIRQFVVDLTIARTLGGIGNPGPLLVQIPGNLISFRESYAAGSNSVDDLMQICLDSPSQNDYVDCRVGAGIESFGFQQFWITNAAISGSNRAVLWIISKPSSLILP